MTTRRVPEWGLSSRIVALSLLLLLLVQAAVFSVVRISIEQSARRQVAQVGIGIEQFALLLRHGRMDIGEAQHAGEDERAEEQQAERKQHAATAVAFGHGDRFVHARGFRKVSTAAVASTAAASANHCTA